MKKPLVTVLVCTYNDGLYLRRCITSILAQTYKPFEFVIINDGSTDNVDQIVRSFKDKRIKYYPQKKNSGSLAAVKNIGMKYVRTEYVFLTDGDCAPSSTWLEKGMAVFKKTGADAVEGRVVYNYEGYKPRFRDRVIKNPVGGLGQTANMAYRTKVMNKYEYRCAYDGMEDRDMYLRMVKVKPIPFAPDVLVFHQQKLWTIQSYLGDVYRHIPRVRLFKTYRDTEDLTWRIVQPAFLFLIVLPFLLVVPILQGRVRTWADLGLLPFAYVKALFLRVIIWKTAIEERVFII